MKSMSSVIGAVVVVLLIGAATAMCILSPPDLDPQFQTAVRTIHKIRQLGLEWGLEAARARADPNSNFDGLVEFVPRMKQMKRTLRENLVQIPGLPDRVAANSRAYIAAMESLRERIERYKTVYSVVRNSRRYLPFASTALVRQAFEFDEDELARKIGSIVRELNEVLANPEPTRTVRLRERIVELETERLQGSPVLRGSLSSFTAHAKVLLDKSGREDELFQGIASSALTRRAAPLTDALGVEQEERHRIVTQYRFVAMALVACAMLVLVGLTFRRRTPSRKQDG